MWYFATTETGKINVFISSALFIYLVVLTFCVVGKLYSFVGMFSLDTKADKLYLICVNYLGFL